MGSMKIQTRELDLFYGDLQALNKVNFAVEPNSITALIGSSGCGITNTDTPRSSHKFF